VNAIGFALALLVAPLVEAADPARFDHYLLALAVAPAFCEDDPQQKRNDAQCRGLSDAAFKATPLTLHGLWPNRRDQRHPQWCGGERRGAFCRMPAVHLPTQARVRLARVMPATADCLDRYQWAKHGRCAGLPEADYFAAAAALTERVNRALGPELARHAGREVELATLRAALARRDPALRDAVGFDCRTPRTPDPAKRRPMLREVRVVFERSPLTGAPGRPLPIAHAGMRHYNSGCPRGRAYVDSPLD
jgi:ribonuclease I